MKFTKIVCKYRKAPIDQYGYTEGKDYVDLDERSGGYPYAVYPMKAYDFPTLSKAEEYAKSFAGTFDIVELTFEVMEKLV
jgi:hypothetical protein